MNKAQIIGIAAGVTVGLLGVAVGVALARQEGREAARKWLAQTSEMAQRSQSKARELGEQVRRSAIEQYQAQAPKVQERLSGLVSVAPQAADALNAALNRGGLNGAVETSQEG
ncbi:MAG TPA: hypothetical protein VFQ25_09060 [Ktedonobacterales bacterium]|nr:hypothetical protein [Ktedonobacterales bacterium]